MPTTKITTDTLGFVTTLIEDHNGRGGFESRKLAPPAGPTGTFCTRAHYFASSATIGSARCVDLKVSLERTAGGRRKPGYRVTWNVNRGRGWAKGYARTEATEAEALAFAEGKWSALLAWLERSEPLADNWQPDFTCH